MRNPKSKISHSPVAFAENKAIINEHGEMVDFLVLRATKEFERIAGCKQGEMINQRASKFLQHHEGQFNKWMKTYGDVVRGGGEKELVQYSESLDTFFKVQVSSPGKGYFNLLLTDYQEENERQKAVLQKMIEISESFLQSPDDTIDFQKIADDFREITQSKFVFFNLYDEDGKTFTTQAFSGNVPTIRNSEKILGFSIKGKQWKHDAQREKLIDEKTVTRFASLSQLAGSVIPSMLIKSLEKTFSLGETVIVKIQHNKRMLGDFTIVMKKDTPFENDQLAQIFSRQAGVLITRYRAEIKRKKTEKQLRDERNFAHQIMNSVGQGLTIVDKEGSFTFVNPAYADLLGYSPEELIGKQPEDLTLENDTKTLFDEFKKRKKGQSTSYQNILIHKSGQHIPVLITGVPVINNKTYSGTISIITDLQEIKKKEKTIELQKLQLRQIIDLVPHFIYAKDSEGRYLLANKAFARFLEGTPKSIEGKTDVELGLDPKQLSHRHEVEKKVLDTGQNIEIPKEKVRLKDGSIIWLQTVKIPYNHPGWEKPSLLGISIDITKRLKAEELLSESEGKFRALAEQSIEMIYLHDLKGNLVEVNKAALHHGGFTREELLQRTVFDLHSNALGKEKIIRQWEALPLDQPILMEDVHRKKDGSTYPVEINTGKILIGNRKYMLAMVRDITAREEAARALKSQEEKLRQITDNMNEVFWLASADMQKMIYLNPAYEKVWGQSRKQLYENINSFLDPIAGDDKPLVINAFENYKRGEAFNIEFRIIRPDGELRWLHTRTLPVKNEKGEIIRHAGIAQDITEQKYAREELKRREKLLQSILQSQKELISRFKPDTTLTFVNDAYCNYFKKSREELLGTRWVEYLPHEDQDKIMQHLQSLAQSPDDFINYQYYTILPNNASNWQEWTDYKIHDEKGKFIGFQSVGIDITDKKEKEKLEKEIEVTRNTLRFKQNFLASMSHEIRTPLTGIMGIAELLEQTTLTPTQLDYIATLRLSSENLQTILDQVLDYSKIESGKTKLAKAPFKVQTLMDNSKLMFESICRKPISFVENIDPQLPPIIEADLKRLSQVINNLIINAIKFTHEGKISLSFALEKEINNKDLMVRVEIADTGIGIIPEKHEHIFDAFSQVHQIDSHEYQGVGLGLAISKELVELHQGQIGVRSQKDKGSTFWFTFKAHCPGKGTQLPENLMQSRTLPARNLKILLAEDKQVTQKIITMQLNSFGHSVRTASNGLEVLQVFNPGDFDLILMDIQMPVMDGITATQKLRERYTDLPPIVGLSANAFEGDREKYMRLGLDEFLTKPLQKEKFLKILKMFWDQPS